MKDWQFLVLIAATMFLTADLFVAGTQSVMFKVVHTLYNIIIHWG
jgi:hypothetical protein